MPAIPPRFEVLPRHLAPYRKSNPEVFDEGELVYTDGDEEMRSPVDGCTIFMPSSEATVGKEAV